MRGFDDGSDLVKVIMLKASVVIWRVFCSRTARSRAIRMLSVLGSWNCRVLFSFETQGHADVLEGCKAEWHSIDGALL